MVTKIIKLFIIYSGFPHFLKLYMRYKLTDRLPSQCSKCYLINKRYTYDNQ